MADAPEPIEMRLAFWILALSFGAMLFAPFLMHPAPAPWLFLIPLVPGIALAVFGMRKQWRLKQQLRNAEDQKP